MRITKEILNKYCAYLIIQNCKLEYCFCSGVPTCQWLRYHG